MLVRMAKNYRFSNWKTLQLQQLAPQAQAHEAHKVLGKVWPEPFQSNMFISWEKTMVLNIGAPTPDNAEIVLGVAGKVQCLNIRKGCNEAGISEMRVSR